MSYRRHLMMQGGSKKNYLYYEALADGTFTCTIAKAATTDIVTSVSYSLDGRNWTTLTNVNSKSADISDTINITTGQKVYIKGIMKKRKGDNGGLVNLNTSYKFNLGGNVASLLFGDNFEGKEDYTFTNDNNMLLQSAFANKYVVDASNLIIPFNTPPANAYKDMFMNCTYLVLPPTTIKVPFGRGYVCSQMFRGCTSLTTMPNLIIDSHSGYAGSIFEAMFYDCTSLEYFTPIAYVYAGRTGSNCAFKNMFKNCTSLEQSPFLEIRGDIDDANTSFTSYGTCENMFSGCTKLKKAPVLPASTITTSCYLGMFYNCSQLDYIKVLVTTLNGTNPITSFATNCKSSGIVVKHIDATWTGNVPSGWTTLYFDPSTEKYYLSDKTTECDANGNTI